MKYQAEENTKVFKCACGYETNSSFAWCIHSDYCTFEAVKEK